MSLRPDIFLALIVFCIVSSVTPGPNNMMLMASGVNYGVRRTLPHLIGVSCGFALMVALVGTGLDALFRLAPWAFWIMKYAGAAYLLWLAWKIARAGAVKDGAAVGRPLGFLGAAAFQWINPKAWVMAVSALTAYAVSENYATTVAIIALTYLACFPCSAVWVVFGAAMRRYLADPGHARWFNWTMAALLVASILPTLRE
jgi:threonine/homoserine/homoserine lactone efflux protein